MAEAALILGMMVVTYATRYTVMGLWGRAALPDLALRWLRFVPVSVLTAIIVLSTLAPQGTVDLRLANAYFWGGLATVLIAWRTRRMLPTIVGGMVIFWVWRLVVS
ncbi:MAG: AzlD domain-containing protein [Anaerolineae bacterium]|nr:AzlD domain-containing protein [Anaerolineae bacterium]